MGWSGGKAVGFAGAGAAKGSKGAAKGSMAAPKGGKGAAIAPAVHGQRAKAVPHRITGTLTAWKGKFGWITPATPISHPNAEKHGGKVYLAQEDVEAEISGPGATVSFFAYSDGQGLGAMNVRPAAPPAVQKQIQKPVAAKAAKSAPKAAPQEPREPKEQTPPDKTKREVLSTAPVAGTVKKAHGQVCWIKPEEPVDHPGAKKRRGLLYLHSEDLEEPGEFPLPGAQVMFFVYADDEGLGAERCQIVEQGSAKVATEKVAEKAMEQEPKAPGQRVRKNKGKAKAKAEGKAEPKGPSGPHLPRERITTEPVTGEVLAWMNKYGWIKPDTEIDHPDAQKHDGKIYIHMKDLQEGSEMEKGKGVTFHVFCDASGLGAEECMAF